MKKIILSVLVSMSFLVGCGGAPDSEPTSDKESKATAPEFAMGDECGAKYTGLYGSFTYGLYNEKVDACIALKGECLPINQQAVHDGPYVCTAVKQ